MKALKDKLASDYCKLILFEDDNLEHVGMVQVAGNLGKENKTTIEIFGRGKIDNHQNSSVAEGASK